MLPPAMCRKAYQHQYLTSIRSLAMFTRRFFCLTTILLAAASAAVYIARAAAPDAGSHEPASRLAVVWSSGDLDVAHRVCLMDAHGAPEIFRRPYRQRREAFSDAEKGIRADRSRIRENSESPQNLRILTNSATKILHGVALPGPAEATRKRGRAVIPSLARRASCAFSN
jgi:hypothetical protein